MPFSAQELLVSCRKCLIRNFGPQFFQFMLPASSSFMFAYNPRVWVNLLSALANYAFWNACNPSILFISPPASILTESTHSKFWNCLIRALCWKSETLVLWKPIQNLSTYVLSLKSTAPILWMTSLTPWIWTRQYLCIQLSEESPPASMLILLTTWNFWKSEPTQH